MGRSSTPITPSEPNTPRGSAICRVCRICTAWSAWTGRSGRQRGPYAGTVTGMLAGVIAALATPWDPAGGLDVAGLERLVERVAGGGVHGISPAGSTGEGAMLTPAQRAELTRRVRGLAPAGMPVITGLPLR